MKNDLLRSYYLRFDWSGWIALIKSKIFITTGITRPISSVKWKAPQLASRFGSFPWHLARLDIPLYLSGAWDWVSHTVWSSKGYSLLRTQKKTFFKFNKSDLLTDSFHSWKETVPHRKWNFALRQEPIKFDRLLATRKRSLSRISSPLVCKLKHIVLPGLQTQTKKMSRSVYNYRLIRLNGLSCITDGDNFD